MTRRDRSSTMASGGRKLLEFVVAGVVVAILAGVLLHRLHSYRKQTELLAVERTVGVLRTALAIRAGHLAAQGRLSELEELTRENPMDWLSRPPPDYAGEFSAPAQGVVPPGHWYFDRKQHLLVYLLNSGEIFPHGSVNDQKYAVKLLHWNSGFSRSRGAAPVGVALVRVAG